MPTTPLYTEPVTTGTPNLAGVPGLVIEYADIAPVQCEHCADVDALTAVRLYAHDADRDTETCAACAPHVAAEFTRLTDRDVLVELDPWRCA